MTKKVLILVPFLLLLLAGCGSSDRETKLSLSKNGVLTQTIVEDWDQDYYDQSELEKEMEAAVDANPKVSMKSLRIKDGKATAKLVYDSAEAYMDFNGVTCFWGTAAEAVAAGYSLAGKYLDREGNEVSLTTVLNNEKPYRVLILSEPVAVELPGKIFCASPGVEIRDARHAKVRAGGEHPKAAGEETAESAIPEGSGQQETAALNSSDEEGLQLWLDEPVCIVYRY